MTAKQRLLEYIASLPEEISEKELEEHLRVHQKIQAGIQSAREAPLLDNEELPGLIEQWLAEE